MRRKVIAGNWKMNMLPNEAIEYIEAFAPLVKDSKSEVILCVPYTDLFYCLMNAQGTNIKIGPASIVSNSSNSYNYVFDTPNQYNLHATKGVILSSGANKANAKLSITDNVIEMSDETCTIGSVKTTFSSGSILQNIGTAVTHENTGTDYNIKNTAGAINITSKNKDGNVNVYAKEFHVEGDVTAKRVWNAVYNDLGEYMEKADYSEEIKEGDVVVFTDDGKVTKPRGGITDINRIAGIVSSKETLGFVLGGDGLEPNQRVPVALAGRVYLNTEGLDVQAGDLIALSSNGSLKIVGDYSRAVIGKATKHSAEGKTYVLVK